MKGCNIRNCMLSKPAKIHARTVLCPNRWETLLISGVCHCQDLCITAILERQMEHQTNCNPSELPLSTSAGIQHFLIYPLRILSSECTTNLIFTMFPEWKSWWLYTRRQRHIDLKNIFDIYYTLYIHCKGYPNHVEHSKAAILDSACCHIFADWIYKFINKIY